VFIFGSVIASRSIVSGKRRGANYDRRRRKKGLDEQKRDLQVDADLLGEASATHSHTQTDALRNFATWSAYVYHSCQNTKGQMDFNEHLISGLPDDTFSN
jgi:hypothetical protein